MKSVTIFGLLVVVFAYSASGALALPVTVLEDAPVSLLDVENANWDAVDAETPLQRSTRGLFSGKFGGFSGKFGGFGGKFGGLGDFGGLGHGFKGFGGFGGLGLGSFHGLGGGHGLGFKPFFGKLFR